MLQRSNRILVLLGVSLTFACVSFSPATDALTDALAAVRRAEAADAEAQPEAARKLQLARQEITKARALLDKGKNEPAYQQALRANDDAALALALARKAEQRKLAAGPRRALAAEQHLALEAQRRVARVAAELAGIAAVEQREGGLIITLGDDVLLPEAQAKLERIAANDTEAKYVVNSRSRDRANVVRECLIALGIAPDRIEIVVERHSASDGLPTKP